MEVREKFDQTNKDAPVLLRRRRKAARQLREKTPDRIQANSRRFSDEESSSAAEQNAQTHRIYIQTKPDTTGVRTILKTSTAPTTPTSPTSPTAPAPQTAPAAPSAPISAHRSKILRRRDKTFSAAAARSSSTPRDENADVVALMKSARRSLSSPRHKDESSGSERSGPRKVIRSVIPPPRDEDRPLSRLEANLRRFEDERRKFELEKLKFEKEKRELRYYRKFDNEERRRLIETYRRLNEKPYQPSPEDVIDRQKFVERYQQPAEEPPAQNKEEEPVRGPDYESSTASVTSEGTDMNDIDDEEIRILATIQARKHSQSISPCGTPKRRMSEEQTLKEPLRDEPPPPPVQEEKQEKPVITKEPPLKHRLLVRILTMFDRKPKPKPPPEIKVDAPLAVQPSNSLLKNFFIEARIEWRRLKSETQEELEVMRLERNKCIADVVVIVLLCGFGGLFFRFIEGTFENIYKCEVRKVKRDFIDQLWLTSHNLREEDWKSSARNKLRKFEEELHTAHEAGVTSYSGLKGWNFINSVLFCMTVITTIGYGHIAPQTMFGQGFTILYALIGIPIFLILLADFGKLFTRGIKWAWAYIRRLYYTGSCRKVRKTAEVQQMMKGIDLAYDIAIRRPSQFFMSSDEENEDAEKGVPHTASTQPPIASETPSTPYPETIEIDDEFNLPISLAIFILLLYIFLGAGVYCMWEDWTYFESFYFVFISMSTVGLGDFVPKHPIFMMSSIVYLAFGLALTSMCINVVQLKLSDSLKHATAKIGATIGLTLAEEEAKNSEAPDTPSEVPEVHAPKLEKMDTIPEATPTPDKNLTTTDNNNEDIPPPLLPRKPTTPTTPDPPKVKKPKKFFK